MQSQSRGSKNKTEKSEKCVCSDAQVKFPPKDPCLFGQDVNVDTLQHPWSTHSTFQLHVDFKLLTTSNLGSLFAIFNLKIEIKYLSFVVSPQ